MSNLVQKCSSCVANCWFQCIGTLLTFNFIVSELYISSMYCWTATCLGYVNISYGVIVQNVPPKKFPPRTLSLFLTLKIPGGHLWWRIYGNIQICRWPYLHWTKTATFRECKCGGYTLHGGTLALLQQVWRYKAIHLLCMPVAFHIVYHNLKNTE